MLILGIESASLTASRFVFRKRLPVSLPDWFFPVLTSILVNASVPSMISEAPDFIQTLLDNAFSI